VNEIDERHLRRAIELALAARAAGQRPYGALLVGPTGEVVAEDRSTVLADDDITAHPELKLARWAAQRMDPAAVRAATLYTSCEPCEMCRGAIVAAQIGRVVFALSEEQWYAITPPGAAPGADTVVFEGPALHDEARVAVEGYYRP
jgi:tRNA(Arg) A34 adenosine deaminase TadA